MENPCRVCDSSAIDGIYLIREMMFGSRESFRYFQCGDCGLLQISEIPADLARHYPPDYSMHDGSPPPPGMFRNFVRRRRNAYAISGRGMLGRALFGLSAHPHGRIHQWMYERGFTRESRILDVGCGGGRLLRDLHEFGYRRLTGIDPFLDVQGRETEGLRFQMCSLEQIEGEFDLIMFHHSLEHIGDQRGTFRQAARLLAANGECLVRTPVVSSFAWDTYRENWVQLDAPRHLVVHSIESLRVLGSKAGLELVEVGYDSNEFQFVGSEMYLRDIPLMPRPKGVFTRRQIREFRRRAQELNSAGRGDMGFFSFRNASATDVFGEAA